MRFEWDERKNEMNLAKHGISFETAAYIRGFIGERWHSIGSVRRSYVNLAVDHAYSEEQAEPVVRIISERRATPRERKLYAEALPRR
jgi:uncharacterized protein